MAEVTAFRNNALPYPIYGQPWVVELPVMDADGDLVTGMSTPDSEVSKNGDTFVDCTNEATEIATSSGVYYLILTGSEMTADAVAVIVKSATTGMKTTTLTFQPRKLASVRTGTTNGGTSTTIVLDSGASAVDDFYNGMVVIAVIDTVTEIRMIGDYDGSTKTATIMGGAWVTASPDTDDTFDIRLPEGRHIAQVDVVSWKGTAVATPNTAGVPSVDTVRVGGTTQTARDLGANIDATVSSRATQTSVDTVAGYVDTEVAAIKTVTDGLNAKLATLQSDTDDIQTRLPAALASGRMDASVGATQTNAIVAAGIASDALTAIANAIATRAGADPASVPAATAGLAAKIDWICAAVRNKGSLDRGTGIQTLRNAADNATIGSRTATDLSGVLTTTAWS